MPEADLILHNARIITLNPYHPKADTIIIKNDKILAVIEDGNFNAFNGHSTEVIDC